MSKTITVTISDHLFDSIEKTKGDVPTERVLSFLIEIAGTHYMEEGAQQYRNRKYEDFAVESKGWAGMNEYFGAKASLPAPEPTRGSKNKKDMD